MIVNMERTTTSKIEKKLLELREDGGVVALGRVLTLIIETNSDHLEEAIEAANGASRLHPSRIIVLVSDLEQGEKPSRLDAEIRIGGDAGASEVVVIRAFGDANSNTESMVTGLLLPDAPVVAWWPSDCKANPSKNPIGQIATRRITDAAAQRDESGFLRQLAKNYEPGDSDMSWTRITLWRSQLAALFDNEKNRRVVEIRVLGSIISPSVRLLAGWLSMQLGVDAKIIHELSGIAIEGIAGVEISFDQGELAILRSGDVASIGQTGSPDSSVLLPKRSDQDCLMEDMRFLGEDEVYGAVLKNELSKR
jgi:glucose-6-phosphate dehydrogenase assembly protein OpcA